MDVRPYGPDDEDAVISLWAQDPEFVESPLHRDILRMGDMYDVHLVSVDGGTLAAYGAAYRPPWVSREGIVAARMIIARDHAGRGLGSQLWGIVREGIDHATTVVTVVSDIDERSLQIARHWGFEEFQHAIESAISLPDRPPPVALPDGYRFEELDDVRHTDRPDLNAMLAAADTSPESGVMGASQMAGFDASSHPVLTVVVHDEDHPVGAIFVTGEGRDADLLFTAVHPDHRRRGLARALKQEMHRVAFDRGFRRITTSNEASNTSIRALNRELGYERVRGVRRVRLTPG